VTSVARVEDVQIFLKDPVFIKLLNSLVTIPDKTARYLTTSHQPPCHNHIKEIKNM